MPSRRRSSSTSSASSSSYSPSRSSSAGPHPRNAPRNYIRNHAPRPKKPSFKTTAVLIAAIAVATICVHRVWTKHRSGKDNHHHHRPWEDTPGRRSVRRNVVRDRHNGYIIDEHEEWTRRRRLPERECYGRDRDRRSRFYDDESDGYRSDCYYPPPPPSNRTQQRLPRSRADGRSGRSLVEENFVPVFEGPRDEVVRYEKAPTVRSATAGAAACAGESTQQVVDEDTTSRRRVEDAVEDWNRRGSRRFPSPERRETVLDDRRSRRTSAYN